jgi:hypothetical protein
VYFFFFFFSAAIHYKRIEKYEIPPYTFEPTTACIEFRYRPGDLNPRNSAKRITIYCRYSDEKIVDMFGTIARQFGLPPNIFVAEAVSHSSTKMF